MSHWYRDVLYTSCHPPASVTSPIIHIHTRLVFCYICHVAQWFSTRAGHHPLRDHTGGQVWCCLNCDSHGLTTRVQWAGDRSDEHPGLSWAAPQRMTSSTCLLYRELSREKDASLRSRGATWAGNPSAPFWLQCPHFSNIRDELWSSNDVGSNPESSVFWASCVMLGKLLIQDSLSLSVKWE